MTLPTELHQIFRNHTSELLDYLVAIRRDLHRHPELSGEEAWTAAYIADKLSLPGLEVHTGVGGHGIVVDLTSDPAKPTVALRVDMDALPIHEVNEIPYRSQIPGVMHACGHDVHCAIGIGTALVLTQMKENLPGNIRFLFQPEEEEVTGAIRMIQAGALTHPVPRAIFGLHVAPIPVGQVAWTDDLFLAGFDHYLASLSPLDGTTADVPHLDALALRCCKVIQDLNEWQLPMTWRGMQEFWINMHAGPDALRRFIIYDADMYDEDPSEFPGQFGIGVKAAQPHLRQTALERIRSAVAPLCLSTQTQFQVELMGSMPDMRNDRELVHQILPMLGKALGDERLIQLNAAFPFNCEDFAFYTQKIPGAMFWLGAANPEDRKFSMLHTDNFNVDEDCLWTGVVAMSTVLMEALISLIS